MPCATCWIRAFASEDLKEKRGTPVAQRLEENRASYFFIHFRVM